MLLQMIESRSELTNTSLGTKGPAYISMAYFRAARTIWMVLLASLNAKFRLDPR